MDTSRPSHPHFGDLVWELQRTGFSHYAGLLGGGATVFAWLCCGLFFGLFSIHNLLSPRAAFLDALALAFAAGCFVAGASTGKKLLRRSRTGPFSIRFYEQGLVLDHPRNRGEMRYAEITAFTLETKVHRYRRSTICEIVLSFATPSGQHFVFSSIDVTSNAFRPRRDVPLEPIEKVTMHPVPAAVAIARSRVGLILSDIGSGRPMEVQIEVPWAMTTREATIDTQSIRITPKSDERERSLPLASLRLLNIRLTEIHGVSLGMKERHGWKDFTVYAAERGGTDGLTQLLALRELLSRDASDDQPEADGPGSASSESQPMT